MARTRDYRQEYDEYHKKPEQKQRRAERNAARNKAKARGAVRKGDGKDVDHVGSNRTGSLARIKTRILNWRKNRSRQPKRK